MKNTYGLTVVQIANLSWKMITLLIVFIWITPKIANKNLVISERP